MQGAAGMLGSSDLVKMLFSPGCYDFLTKIRNHLTFFFLLCVECSVQTLARLGPLDILGFLA